MSVIRNEDGTVRQDVVVLHSTYVTPRVSMAWKLLEHFAVIAARDDGEDSAGRHKIKLSDPHETVQRCFDLADSFIALAGTDMHHPNKQDVLDFARMTGEVEREKTASQYDRIGRSA